MATVTTIVTKARRILPGCEHEWSYPYGIRFDASGRPRAMEWMCNRCGRRQRSQAA